MTTTLAPSLFDGFTIESKKTGGFPGWSAEHGTYLVTVTNPRGRRYSTPFVGVTPTVELVLEDMLRHAASFTATQGFEEWAAELGYEWETRAERRELLNLYRHCERLTWKVETFFTPKELFLITEHIDNN